MQTFSVLHLKSLRKYQYAWLVCCFTVIILYLRLFYAFSYTQQYDRYMYHVGYTKPNQTLSRCRNAITLILCAHHKAGHTLAQHIYREINGFCQYEVSKFLTRKECKCHHIKRLTKKDINKNKNVSIIHIIRNPLYKILSAYNYHKLGTEKWTQSVFLRSTNQINRQNLRKISIDLENIFNISLNRHDSLYTLYQRVDVLIGLFMEYDMMKRQTFNDEHLSSFNCDVFKAVRPNHREMIKYQNIKLESLTSSTKSFQTIIVDILVNIN
eukprot:539918_1